MNGERKPLSRQRFYEAAEMLGVGMVPDGNPKILVSGQRPKAVDWGGKVRRGISSRKVARTVLSSNISAKLKYSPPACTLVKKECKLIMCPAIRAVSPKSGISASMVVDIRDNPGKSGGLGTISLYYYMGTTTTSLLVEQLFRGTPLGFSIRVGIEDLVIDAGRYGALWDMLFPNILKYIDNHSWVYAVIEYNHLYEISLHSKH